MTLFAKDGAGGESELSNIEINRYSRQIILPGVGVPGQSKLKNATVLIVGVGGLGCPCALYLAGAGIGHIGLVDYDDVELNNIHRQILHREASVGSKKVDSAAESLHSINSSVKISKFHMELNSKTADAIISNFDIVVDASDNVATRYLLNDACFFHKKPLVSGSALQFEGQLTVYHLGDGPCYRCLFPVPPPPAAVTNCGEGGVLGPIPGTIGVLQSIQVINILLGKETLAKTLLLFDGSDCSFRRVRLRNRSPDCALCGDRPSVTSLVDYEAFCSAKANDKNPNLQILSEKQRVTATEFSKLKINDHVLIDVRSEQEFNICHIPGSVNIPIKMLLSEKQNVTLENSLCQSAAPVYVICRRGNDSQKAAMRLKNLFKDKAASIKDIVGGLHAWSKDVDPNFPVY